MRFMEKTKITDLVIKSQKGDKDALTQLINEIYNDLYYYILKTVKDENLAADITQESCIEIITTIDKLQSPEAFSVWSKRIAFHQCTRYFRKTKDVLVDENEEGETIFDELVDESEDALPEQVLEDKEFRKTIMDMINSLSPEQSNALLLYYYEKMSVKQIAEIQDTTEGTVKSRLNYARKAIKYKVEEYEERTGTKLHSIAILPFLLRFVFGSEKSTIPTLSVPAAVTASVGTTMAGTTATASIGTTATVVATKGAGTALVTKIIAGVLAASIVIGGAVFGISKLSNNRDNGEDYEGSELPKIENSNSESYNNSFGDESNVVSEDENWEGTTDVNFRIVLKNTMSERYCTVTLWRYDSMTAEEPSHDESFDSSFPIYGDRNWQKKISLEPGFYEVIGVSIPSLNPKNIRGSSERFEVKGKEMTVYVATDCAEDPVDMPENWLIYGEDNQNFYIWATKTEEVKDTVKKGNLEFTKYTKGDGTVAYELTDGEDYEQPELTIPQTINGIPVDKIACSAFGNNRNLKKLVIPDHITQMGEIAFTSSYIEEVTISHSISGFRAFHSCSKLKTATFNEGATEISQNMFWDCTELTNVTIASSVTKIAKGAFMDCEKLTEITYLGTKEQWENIELDINWENKRGAKTIHCTDGDITIY